MPGPRDRGTASHDGLMSPATECPADLTPHARRRGAAIVIAVSLLLGISGGCNRLRLPAVDPTGQCLFSPLPTTTSLALPGSAGEGCSSLDCLRGVGAGVKNQASRLHEHIKQSCPLTGHDFALPEPAFPEPAPPPPCATTPAVPAKGTCGPGEPCVPSAACDGSCKTGPPAVLFGRQCDLKKLLHLPDRGKRGCILLSPQRIVAPVGGEVVLLSGICGTDGYLQTGEPLEWMLTPDSVGTFLQVGDDDPGLLHKLVGSKQPEKRDGSYAEGVTSNKRMLITRGNRDRRDDVPLEKGQTWISLSSPSEGTSHVTVLAPESDCWDQRKATATIYWVDARWQFPDPQRVPAGTPVALTTRVTRSGGQVPAEGWRVRYENLNPELATFAGTGGSPVVEVEVNESGNATAELVPVPGTSGNATLDIQVIRPANETMPRMTLGRGQAFVTWSAPRLNLRAGGPDTATFDVPFEVVANVANPGDQAAETVVVEAAIPSQTRVVQADSFAEVFADVVRWDLGTIPPGQQIDLFLTLAARESIRVRYQARGDGDLFAEDEVRVNIFRPSLELTVSPREDRYQTGDTVPFDIEVRNIGDRPLNDVSLRAMGDEEMVHYEEGTRDVRNDRLEPLQPGEAWQPTVNYVPTASGRRCVEFETTAAGGQQASREACVTVINPPPATPAVSTQIQLPRGDAPIATGDVFIVEGRVINDGRIPLRNVEITMVYAPQMQPVGATEGVDQSRTGQYLLAWNIPELAPEQSVLLEAQFEAIAPAERAQVIFSARTAEGASDSADLLLDVARGAPAAQPPAEPPALPPAEPPPTIPEDRGATPAEPPPADGRGPGPVAPPLPARSGQLELSLLQVDVAPRVNDSIRYSLSVTNDRDVVDGAVSIRFSLPDGVSIVRVTPTTSPGLGEYNVFDDTIILEDIRTLRAGETVDYQLVLRSNQAQRFELEIAATSRLSPRGVSESVQTEVVP